MRLLSYNIHGCVGRGGKVDPGAIINVIREARADVVALQEVHDDNVVDRSFLRALERDLDYPSIIYDPTMELPRTRCGNVLMSRSVPEREERLDLSWKSREPRGAIRVLLRHHAREFEITATHLGLAPAERREQLRRLIEPGIPEAGPDATRILMGDLNEWFPIGRAGRFLRRRFGHVKTVKTFPARWPLFALDRIHVRPSGVRATKRVLDSPAARTASDHLPLVADLEF
jgi:endonuclease/exonuclease/phosphatase family metal-dependent hydrolase